MLLLIFLKRVTGMKANRINNFTQTRFVIQNVTLQHFQLFRLLGGATEPHTQGSSHPEKTTDLFLLHLKMANKSHSVTDG